MSTEATTSAVISWRFVRSDGPRLPPSDGLLGSDIAHGRLRGHVHGGDVFHGRRATSSAAAGGRSSCPSGFVRDHRTAAVPRGCVRESDVRRGRPVASPAAAAPDDPSNPGRPQP